MPGFDSARLVRLGDVLDGYAERGEVTGLAWGLARRGEVHVGAAALCLVEECLIRLDEPVDRLLPELADRRVLADPGGSLDDTVPAQRAITVRDLLTFRLGYGMDFTVLGQQPLLDALAELELETGPPAPSAPPEPGEWMRRLGTLPLEHQPGERWLYHTGADVLGVLVARAAGMPLDDVLRERILSPLGMTDTSFSVPAPDLGRFGAVFGTDPSSGARFVYDEADGQWSTPPAFPSGGAGLVSTVDDYLAFARMLLAGGAAGGRRILSRPSIEVMTTNQLTPEQVAASGPDPAGAQGWGFGVGVQVRRTGLPSVGSYGWDGGLGSSWLNDPSAELAGVILTNQMWSSPQRPTVCEDFWTCAYAAIHD